MFDMKNKMKSVAIATLFAATSATMATPAFAIGNAEECKAAVNEVTRELLKANVSNASLSAIDAAISAADAACTSGDFAGAESQISAARDLIKASGQN